MSTLIFDTETTDLVNFSKPDNDPSQPRLVQLGMMVLDDNWEVMHEVGLIIKPSGFTIPPIATSFHKITTEKALQFGVPLKAALGLFTDFCLSCHTLVAHNVKFDRAVMSAELARCEMKFCNSNPDYHYCTMLDSNPILALKQKGSNRPKWPSLTECVQYFFGEPLVDAHDALTDVRACARIYKHLMTNGYGDRTRPDEVESSDSVPGVSQTSKPSALDEEKYKPLPVAPFQPQIDAGLSGQSAAGTPV